MNYVKSLIVNFVKQEDGPTAVEYAIMLALIVLVCIGSVIAIGESARETFDFVANIF